MRRRWRGNGHIIEPVAESVLLYEGNNDDDPPMLRLGDVLKSITKWPIEALKAIPEEPQQASENSVVYAFMKNMAKMNTFGYVWRHGLHNIIQVIYIYLFNLCAQCLTWLSHVAHDLNLSSLLRMCPKM